jgi:hypothetical protein
MGQRVVESGLRQLKLGCCLLLSLAALTQCVDGGSDSDGDGGAGGEAHGEAGQGTSGAAAGTKPVAGTSGNAGAGQGGSGSVAGQPSGGAPDNMAGAAGQTSTGGDGGASTGGDGGATNAATALRCELPPEYCRNYADCPWYEGCVGDRCVAIAEGTACSDVFDCGKAQYCSEEGQCKNRPIYELDCGDEQDPEGICPEGKECKWYGGIIHGMYEYQCVNPATNTGFCDFDIIGCASDYYCPTDVSEFGEPPYCVERAGLGEACSEEEYGSCLAGLACNGYKCQAAEAPLGSFCTPYVTHWQGVTFREFDSRFPASCVEGSYCRYTEFDDDLMMNVGECTAVEPAGSDCEFSYECDDGYCTAGKCVAPTLDSVCGYRRNDSSAFEPTVCPGDLKCHRNVCKTPLALGDECQQSKRPCPTGSVCHQAVAAGPFTCAPAAELHEECSAAVCIDRTFCVLAPAP